MLTLLNSVFINFIHMHTHSYTSIFTNIFFHLCEAYDKRCMGFNFALVNRDLVELAIILNVNLRKCIFDVASTRIEAASNTMIIIV